MSTAPFSNPMPRLALAVLLTLGLAACAGNVPLADPPGDGLALDVPVIQGPAVRPNRTPLDPAFVCLADGMRGSRSAALGVAVGDIKDYTGKYSTTEGNSITQGGALMIYSALGKLGDTIRLQERFDTRIAELELAYADRRQLGDGRRHVVEPGKAPVPWVPYFGGSIMRSDYYIVGGITELNYNVGSGGAEFSLSGVGFRRRTFTMNIGVDLRIVDTHSLMVIRAVSLQKQIVGVEVGAGVFRFLGTNLVDLNAGSKSQEPLQLGVRMTIEQGVIELIAAVAALDASPCLAPAEGAPMPRVARPLETPRRSASSAGGNGERNGVRSGDLTAPVSSAEPAAAGSGMAARNSGAGPVAGTRQLAFEIGSSALPGAAVSAIERVVGDAAQGAVARLQLLARDTENLPPAQRRELAEQRARVVTEALAARGVAPSRVSIHWLPSSTEAAITRHSPGYQLVATLRIVP